MKKMSLPAGMAGIFLLWLLSWNVSVQAASYPLTVRDSSGKDLTFNRPPSRVVSLVPTATEMLAALQCRHVLAGVTYHDGTLSGIQTRAVMGGFFSPSEKAITAAGPDLLILSSWHQGLNRLFSEKGVAVLVLDSRRLADAEDHLRLLARIFDREAEAEGIIARNREQMDLIRDKVARIPKENRKRVVRLMGREQVMAPGDDSFQNDLIRSAGGLPPVWGKTGAIVPVPLEAWQRFNPQVIYGCGGDRETARAFFDRPGWRDVEAVKKGQVHYFPCDLTCRAGTHTGYFAAWLASVLYTEEFSDPRHEVRPTGIQTSRPLKLDLPYVKEARLVRSTIQDFPNKSLIIDFNAPQKVVSTLEGQRDGIWVVGNHYSPPPAWSLGHNLGLAEVQRRIYQALNQERERASFLFTGADMDNLTVRQAEFREMKVWALVTAGVETNALRLSRDSGNYYEPGTINIILLTNMSLSPRAMTRAVIDATEAKTAALWDLDIRSSYTARVNPATGTGTDNIIVVQGTGVPLDNAGGHTKLGELIATAVYAGVQEAIQKQNGLVPGRGIFQRLRERGLELYALSSQARLACGASDGQVAGLLEQVLLEPGAAAFMESALALSDAYERGLIKDLGPFRQWCRGMAAEIAGRPVVLLLEPLGDADLPTVLRLAFNALLTGLEARGPKGP
jgi:ABC-type Fe3+-hydroxamate transport system substrate-binding protein/adenosylcobinamide amidohydrolase